MTPALAICFCIGLAPAPTAQVQQPRDTPPPVIELARRERDLRAAADREPGSAQAQHQLGAFLQELARRTTDAAVRLNYIRDGLAAEDRALALQPDYMDAMVYKNILLRLQANLSSDPVEQKRLVEEADALRDRVIEMQKSRVASQAGAQSPMPPPPPPPFAGFSEPFEDAVARQPPVRVGGNIPVPTKVKDVKPVYPAEAQAARVQGVVIIEALIGVDGKVQNARVLRSIPLLNDAALDAVSQWAFTPTVVNGVPMPVIMTVTVNFTLME